MKSSTKEVPIGAIHEVIQEMAERIVDMVVSTIEAGKQFEPKDGSAT